MNELTVLRDYFWRSVTGDFIADHTRIISLRDNYLSVEVDQPTLVEELQKTWGAEILRKVNATKVVKISNIAFVIRPPETK